MDPTPTPTPTCWHPLAIDGPTGRTCAACGAAAMPRIRVTFETITPESAEDGDIASSGWIDDDGASLAETACDDDESTDAGDAIARYLTRQYGGLECSDWPPEVTPHRAPWFTEIDPDRDYRTGAETRRSFHVDGLTRDEWAALFRGLRVR